MRAGEAPPTSGLAPRFADLFARGDLAGLERAIAEYAGTSAAILTCSGTAALFIALEYLKRDSPARTVVVPAYTCPLVVFSARRAGLQVIACDTVKGGLDLDLDHLGQLAGKDTLAVVPTHYGGALTGVAAVRAAVRLLAPGAAIVEDAAQAFGARVGGMAAGLAGDIGFYSFAAGKGLTLYEGGALVARDPSLIANLRTIADETVPDNPAFELRRSFEFAAYHCFYNPLGLRWSYGIPRRFWLACKDEVRAASDHFSEPIPIHRVSAWRAGVATAALGRYREHLAATRRRFGELSEMLGAIPDIDVHRPRPLFEPTGTFVFVTFSSQQRCSRALGLLWRSRFGVSKLFAHAIPDYPYLAGKVTPSETPNARDFAGRTLTVTTSPMLTPTSVEHIVRAIAAAAA